LALFAEVGDGLFDVGKAHRSALRTRDDQAIGGADRDRKIDIVVIDDLVALDLALTAGKSFSARQRPW
jgi:hypothetical protein